jgi:predicted DCC family thiol-disulfide oxidoreductase YuxK
MSLHAIDGKEKLYSGIDAFCLIWNNLKGWALLSFVVRMPFIYFVSKMLYSYFALWRFNKMKYCRVN